MRRTFVCEPLPSRRNEIPDYWPALTTTLRETEVVTHVIPKSDPTKTQAAVAQKENGAMPYAAALAMPNQKIGEGRHC